MKKGEEMHVLHYVGIERTKLKDPEASPALFEQKWIDEAAAPG